MLHSIIIPCYKSSQTIREVVELTSAELDRLGRPDYEFILVDDYSPDDGATLRIPDSIMLLWQGLTMHREIC